MASSAASDQENKIGALFSSRNEENYEDQLHVHADVLVNLVAFPMTLKAAIELGVLEIIAKGGQQSAAEVAAQLPGVRNPEAASTMLERMLRLLATFSVLNYHVVTADGSGGERKKLYSLAPAAKYLVPSEDGACLGPVMSLLTDKVFLDGWGKLKDAVLDGGIPFNLAHGTNAFEYPASDPRFNNLFNNAMYNGSTLIMKKIMQSYAGFEGIRELVDVGGGVGNTLKAIVSKYPSIKGINYDLPHVIQQAISYQGIEHVSGNMFENIPSGDAIWMKSILHDWSDGHCIKLLKNCYKALPDNGKVIVIDAIVPDEPETTPMAKLMTLADALMMTQNPGGKERTLKEFQSLANAAGFTDIRLICSAYQYSIMEFYK